MFLLSDYVSGGELFTHLYQREKFKESEVRIYTAEIILALQHLHKVSRNWRGSRTTRSRMNRKSRRGRRSGSNNKMNSSGVLKISL